MFKREQLVDHIGAYRTQSLFLETNSADVFPLMTLKDVDWEYKGIMLPSLRKIYMDLADPTEYEVAIHVLGSWEHWTRFFSNKKIMKYLQQYRNELEVKTRSGAIRAMISTATLDGSKGTSAAKYIAEKGWEKRKAGAPSKIEVQKELKIQTDIDHELEEDLRRIGIH